VSAKAPPEAQLKKVERELRKLPARSQRAVGGGIYMRLDAAGSRRFQFRVRGNGSQAGGTYPTWEEAVAARQEREAMLQDSAELGGLATVYELRKLTVKQYAPHWWTKVITDLDVLTQRDYQYGLEMALEVAGGYTLEQLERAPLLTDEIKRRLKTLKTRPKSDKRYPGVFHRAAADKGLKILSAICGHAVERGVIGRNPFVGIEYFNRKRGANGKRSNGHRAIKQSEVVHPSTLAEVGLGMRGSVAEVEAGRTVPLLIGFQGMRPQDVAAFRHSCWRDKDGPLSHLRLEEAVKDLAGILIIGEPKTGEREPVLWPAVAEQLERVYQAQGCPELDSLVFPNRVGTHMDWGNWRRVWYRALYLAGLSDAPKATAKGAFDPYLCRHICAVTMTHALRPAEVGGGTYSRYEVARHLGHTVNTLDNVYAEIPKDLLGIAGLTMDEIIRKATRDAWGPLPGDADYEERLYTTVEVAEMTGISVNALGARVQRGNLRGVKVGPRYLISDHSLVLAGLLAPPHRRQQSLTIRSVNEPVPA
jgi:hypothetical protein